MNYFAKHLALIMFNNVGQIRQNIWGLIYNGLLLALSILFIAGVVYIIIRITHKKYNM
jgi:hypothetical protein